MLPFAKVFSREIEDNCRLAKVFSAKFVSEIVKRESFCQKFHVFFASRKFLPAKVSALKVVSHIFVRGCLNFLICPITEIRGWHQNFLYSKFGDFGQFYALEQLFFYFSAFFTEKFEFQNSENSVFTKNRNLGHNTKSRFSRGSKTQEREFLLAYL